MTATSIPKNQTHDRHSLRRQPNVAIVTGAARGIGAAIGRKLALEGFRVIGFDQVWQDEAPTCLAGTYTVDVSSFASVEHAAAEVEQRFGAIGVLVNNAGITRDGMSHKMDPSDFMRVLEVNLAGPFHMCRAVLPRMRDRSFGRIVCISSMNALRGQAGQANYTAAKAGLIAMAKSIALENAGKGITANCVAPGLIETAMTQAMRADTRQAEIDRIPAGRIGTPEDVADAVSFLVSDAASFVTGQVLSVNGGQYT